MSDKMMSVGGVTRREGGLCATEGCPCQGGWLATRLPVTMGGEWDVLLCDQHAAPIEKSVADGILPYTTIAPVGVVRIEEES